MPVSEQAVLLDDIFLSVQEIPGAKAYRSTGWTAFHTTARTESCIFQTSDVSTAFKTFQRLLQGEHLHAVQLLTCSLTLPAQTAYTSCNPSHLSPPQHSLPTYTSLGR